MMKRALVLLMLAALLPLIAVRLWVEVHWAGQSHAGMTRLAADHARAVAALIAHDLAADRDVAATLGRSPVFDGPIDRTKLAIVAERALADRQRRRAIQITDPAGTVIFARPDPGNWSIVTVRTPIVRDGRLKYWMVLAADRTSFGGELSSARTLPDDWSVRLFDGRGRLIAASDRPTGLATPFKPADATAFQSALRAEVSSEGDGEYGLWLKVPTTDWRVEVAIAEATYEAPFRRGLLRVGVTVALGAIVLAWFAFLLRRAVVQERRRTAAALRGQRLELLGRMTSGVAHDFNNLLTPIAGAFELLAQRLKHDATTAALIDAGKTSIDRATVLVAHLLAYSRTETLWPRVVDLSEAVAELEDLLIRTIGPGIDLTLDLPAKAVWAKIDPVQLELAIINLAINARDAMPDGGSLTIQIAERTSAYSNDLDPGRYARISIADTGYGMTAEVLKMATEPFFTTKAIGAGRGLGLAMVRKFATESGGTLDLHSRPGKGSTVELWLPARGDPADRTIDRDWLPRRGTGRLLLVDDEHSVRVTHAEILREAGYKVTATATAAEALDILRMEGHFDLMIADFAMPHMSGTELAHEARAADPTLPILIVTGFAGALGDLPQGAVLLMKPVRQAALLARVAELLSARRG